MTNSINKIFFKLNAKSLVDEAYHGLLERSADAEGSTGYVSSLQKDGDLPALLKDLAHSEERWKLNLSRRGEELMEQVFLGLNYRNENAPGPDHYAASLTSSASLSTVLAELAGRSDFIHQYVARHGADLSAQVLTGLLGHQPSDTSINLYEESFARGENLGEALNRVAATHEFWNASFRRHADSVKEMVYTGLLGGYSGRNLACSNNDAFSQPEDIIGLLQDVVGGNAFQDQYWSRISRDVARSLYRGVIGREPDDQELLDLLKVLQRPSDLAVALEKLAQTKEAFDRQMRHHATAVVNEVFRGLLRRDADDEGLSTYTSTLGGLDKLSQIVAGVSDSPERWKLTVRDNAQATLDSTYEAVLGRKPDDEEKEKGLSAICEDGDVHHVLAALASHEELKARHFAAFRLEIVNASYRALFKRDADPAGLTTYSEQLKKPEDIARVLRLLISSEEFYQRQPARTWPHPGHTLTEPAYAFLHIQKTAGTSLQHMLQESWPKSKIYAEHADTLHLRSPGELSTYSMYCGHFNHDSLRYIPRDNLSVFAFLREPKKRLVSLYYFLRAHEPDHQTYSSGHARAGAFSIEDFFKHEDTMRESGFWNHMTWVIVGARRWLAWQKKLSPMANEEDRKRFIESEARPAIEAQLRSFWFVGIQEDFDRSVRLLFDNLNLSQRNEIRKDHTLDGLMRTDPKFKQTLERQDISQEVMRSLSYLTELDAVVYEVGKSLFNERLNGLKESPRTALAS